MNIALPIEIKVREYYSKVLLAYQIIKNTNHQVIIGEKNKIYSIYKNNKDVLLISKGGPEKIYLLKKNLQ